MPPKYAKADRKQNGLTHKLYLIDVHVIKEQNERSYTVMGSTGNVYTVTINTNPNCTCPDYISRKKRCKHIFFVLMRIMKVTDVDKEEYTDDDVKNMFGNIPEITNVLCIDDDKRKKYMDMVSKNKGVNQKTADDDVCPICLDDLGNGEVLDFCKYSCGKNLHKNCFEITNKMKEKHDMKCPFCTKHWHKNENEYINLTL